MQTKKIWIGLVLVVCGGLVWFLVLGSKDGEMVAQSEGSMQEIAEPVANPVLTVEVFQPSAQQWVSEVSASGNIVPWQEASIGSQVNGLRLDGLYANVGDRVKKDQLLASFANETVQAELLQAQANYDSAKANADRARSLRNTSALSPQQIQQYLTEEKVREAALKIAQQRLQNTRLVAPDSGVISARTATLGEVAGMGKELFRLIQQERLEWQAEVVAQDIARIQVGGKAKVTSASGVTVAGQVRSIAPSANPQTRKITVYVTIPKQTGVIAGMFANGVFQLGSTSSLSLPRSAVLLRDGFAYVFVPDAQDKVVLRKVQVGRFEGDRVQLLSGLKSKEFVVASGVGFLRDGDLVKVVK